jgi:hypothetical protein
MSHRHGGEVARAALTDAHSRVIHFPHGAVMDIHYQGMQTGDMA